MGSVTHALSRWFGAKASAPNHAGGSPQHRLQRRSSGLAEFTRSIGATPELAILDLGPTSPANINFLTNLGHKVYNEDILAEASPELLVKTESGEEVSVESFFRYNMLYPPQSLDAVLCWDIPDYLHEPLVKPLVERLLSALRPGGVLLAFFHTKDAGPAAPHYRYHISDKENLELRSSEAFKLQRVFNNRHIENLFRDYRSFKFFLAKDNIREVLVTR